jgi:predicted permease
MIETLWQDLRYALRGLRRSPGFAAAAIVTLALGVGANTAIFSFVEAVLLRPLPVRAPEQLFFVAHGVTQPLAQTSSNYPYFERLRARSDVFAGVTAYSMESLNVSTGGPVEVVEGQFVSGNYHGLLGVPMVLGRGFSVEDDRRPADGLIAVLSHDYWTRALGADPNVLGRTLIVQNTPLTIVGVTTRGFTGFEAGRRAEISIPMSAAPALDDETYLTAHDNLTSMPIVARLNPGVSEEQGAAAVHSVLQQYLSEPDNQWWRTGRNGEPRFGGLLAADRGSDSLRRRYSDALLVLMAIVAIVLLIGCVNVANLLLARAAARRKEVAVRLSLGAGRRRLVGQFFTESLLLAAAGGLLGFAVARAGSGAIAGFMAMGENPVLVDLATNRSVLLFTTVLAATTALMCGLLPALAGTRVDISPALRDAADSSRQWSRRQVLVAGQLALSVVLIAAAGLLVRTLRNLEATDPGFDRTNVLMFQLTAEGTAVPQQQLSPLCDQVRERLVGRPGVMAGSCSTSVPVRGSGSTRGITVAGLPPADDRDAFSNEVTAGYFETFGLRLVRGRFLTAADTAGSPRVAVINERLAREYFNGIDPLGRALQFGIGRPGPPLTIVGVVHDTLQFNDLRDEAPRTVYTPLSQRLNEPDELSVSLQSSADLTALAGIVRADVAAVNDDVVVDYIRTMDTQIGSTVVRERVLAVLAIWFGGLALVLTVIGLYGVLSYEVGRRRRDIGIRLALGAPPALIRRQVLSNAALVALGGVTLGVLLARATTRIMSALLFKLTPTDPWALGTAAALLVTVALAAAYVPANRAARIDPVLTLKSE